MNPKVKLVVTWGVATLVVAFVGRVVYKAIKKKRESITSDTDIAKKLNKEAEELLDKIKNAPK
jgi:F0F1-type ATP synthase membrane subunit b/b'